MRTCASLLVMSFSVAVHAAPPKAATESKAGSDVAAMLATMGKYAEPSEGHKHLKAFEGEWDTQLTVYVKGQAQPAEKGRAELWFILGGRFLAEEYWGTFMGKAVSSHILFGYDNARQKFTSVRITSLNTDMMVRDGTADASGKVITLTGESFDPPSGKNVPGRMVYRSESADRFSVEVYETRDGKEARLFDVVYTRKKAG